MPFCFPSVFGLWACPAVGPQTPAARTAWKQKDTPQLAKVSDCRIPGQIFLAVTEILYGIVIDKCIQSTRSRAPGDPPAINSRQRILLIPTDFIEKAIHTVSLLNPEGWAGTVRNIQSPPPLYQRCSKRISVLLARTDERASGQYPADQGRTTSTAPPIR